MVRRCFPVAKIAGSSPVWVVYILRCLIYFAICPGDVDGPVQLRDAGMVF